MIKCNKNITKLAVQLRNSLIVGLRPLTKPSLADISAAAERNPDDQRNAYMRGSSASLNKLNNAAFHLALLIDSFTIPARRIKPKTSPA